MTDTARPFVPAWGEAMEMYSATYAVWLVDRNPVLSARMARTHAGSEIGDALEAELRRRSRCRRCGLKLTDDVSIARGLGPVCAAKEEEACTDPPR